MDGSKKVQDNNSRTHDQKLIDGGWAEKGARIFWFAVLTCVIILMVGVTIRVVVWMLGGLF